MLDDLDRLRNNPHLQQLLSHYANLGHENREVWQHRLMEVEGLGPADITKLHGELIAFSWVEQNTGQVPCCYRITLNGQRAIRLMLGVEVEEEPEIREKPRVGKKKREKSPPPEAVSMAMSE